MKKVLILLLVLALLLPTAALGEEKIDLVFWVNDGSTQWMDVWESAANDYMALHPNIHIEVVGIPWAEAATKFNTAAATDTLPDMAHLASSILSTMLAQDKVVDLTPYYEKYEGKDNLNQAHINYYRNYNPKKPGLWEAPMFGSDQQIWYRKDWFEAANMEFPETWDQWFEAIAAMTKDGHYGWSFRGGPGGWDHVLSFLAGYTDSKSFFDENGKSFLRRDGIVEALKRYIGIYKDGMAPPTSIANGYTEMIAEFANGNAAMAWHHLQSESLITSKLDVSCLGYGYFPKDAQGNRIRKSDAQGVAVFTSCPEEKRQAAWDYIEFLWTSEQQLQMIQKGGGVPTNLTTDVSSMPFVQMALQQAADEATVGLFQPEYLADWTSFVNEEVLPDTQAMMLGEMEPEAAVEKWATRLEEMLEEYNAM